MIYDYIKNIIDNKSSLGQLECIHDKIITRKGRDIYCIGEQYKELQNKITDLVKDTDFCETSIKLKQFNYLVFNKGISIKQTEAISITIYSLNNLRLDNEHKYVADTKRDTNIIFYKNNDITYHDFNKKRIAPYMFPLVPNPGKYISIINYLNLAILEYYKDTYHYLYKDYYEEYLKCVNEKMNVNLSIRQEYLKDCKTKAEYFNRALKSSNKITGYNFNRHSFCTDYVVAKIFNAVNEKSQKWLINQPTINLNYHLCRVKTIPQICSTIINNNIDNKELITENTIAYDYVRLCQSLRHKINIVPTSYNNLRNLHDKEVALSRKKESKKISEHSLIKENSKFAPLYAALPKEFVPLTNERQLFLEGEKQHNCVHSYSKLVKRDTCAIFHIDLNTSSYTLEVRVVNKRYAIYQLQKTCNSGFNEDDYKYIQNKLNCIKYIESTST